MSLYEDYIAISRYAKYLPKEKRRETWEETVDRYFDYMENSYPITRKVIGVFVSEPELHAYAKIGEWEEKNSPVKKYSGDDGKEYPRFERKSVDVF